MWGRVAIAGKFGVGLGDVGALCLGYWGFSKASKILLGDML